MSPSGTKARVVPLTPRKPEDRTCGGRGLLSQPLIVPPAVGPRPAACGWLVGRARGAERWYGVCWLLAGGAGSTQWRDAPTHGGGLADAVIKAGRPTASPSQSAEARRGVDWGAESGRRRDRGRHIVNLMWSKRCNIGPSQRGACKCHLAGGPSMTTGQIGPAVTSYL
jgi:hypothetical protein